MKAGSERVSGPSTIVKMTGVSKLLPVKKNEARYPRYERCHLGLVSLLGVRVYSNHPEVERQGQVSTHKPVCPIVNHDV